MYNYILVDREPIPEPDLLKWARWIETADCIVARTQITPDVLVSTVFLGIDYGCGSGKPILFETMVFGGDHDSEQRRYATWQEAEIGHGEMVAMLQQEDAD